MVGAVVLLVVAGSAVAWSVAASRGDVDDLLPNLTQAAPNELSGRTGGTAAAPRFFLGFESAAGNLGVGPLLVLGRRSGTEQEMSLRQRILRSDGTERTVPLRATLRYVRSRGHSHWHVLGFMRYELRNVEGASVVKDRKTGFCLGDRYRVELTLPGRAPNAKFSDRCGKGAPGLKSIREGISVGWGDNYLPTSRARSSRSRRSRRGATCWSTASTRTATCVRATTPTTSPRWRSRSVGRADRNSLPHRRRRPVPRDGDLSIEAPATRRRCECQYLRDEPDAPAGARRPKEEGEMDSPSLRLRLGAEALGTFLFFFLGFNAVAVSVDIGAGAIDSLGIAFAFGLGLALAIAALGHVSGGHFNPAVSLGLAAARKFPPKEILPYWIAQLVGGFVAVLAVAIVYSGTGRRCARHCSRGRHLGRGRAPAGADCDRPLRDRDLHRRDG